MNIPGYFLVDLTEQVENRLGLPIGPAGNSRFAVTGEPFVSFGCQGIKGEGQVHLLTDNPIEAASKLIDGIGRYADEMNATSHSGHILFWRTLPEIQECEGKWTGFARLLISNKDPLEIPVK